MSSNAYREPAAVSPLPQDEADPVAARRKERQRRLRELEAAEEELRADERDQAEEEELAYREQRLKDERRRRELERKHGRKRILSVDFDAWAPDAGPQLDNGEHVQAATRFICLLPEARSRRFKIMQKTLARLDDNDREGRVEEIERAAREAIVYPHPANDRAMYQATINLTTEMILGNLANQMFKAMGGREDAARKK